MTEYTVGDGGLSRRQLFKRGLLYAGELTGVLIVAQSVVGCGGSSGGGGGGSPNPSGGSGGGGTTSTNLMAHLKSEYDITPKSDPLGEQVQTVRSKSTGGVLADQNVMIFLKDSTGKRIPIRGAASGVTVTAGTIVEIGQTVTTGTSVSDPLEDYTFVSGPHTSAA